MPWLLELAPIGLLDMLNNHWYAGIRMFIIIIIIIIIKNEQKSKHEIPYYKSYRKLKYKELG